MGKIFFQITYEGGKQRYLMVVGGLFMKVGRQLV